MRMLTTGLWIIGALLAGYCLILLLMYTVQSKLVYYPVSAIPYTPEDIGLQYEETFFSAKDSVKLHGWFVPHENPRGTILFQHGNAGNISGRLETVRTIHNLGMNIFIYDYRGYGKSEGSPDEAGTYRDAKAAWNYLTQKQKVPANQIIVMGRSLGGAVTAWLATEVRPAGVILESTFTSAADLAEDLYPMFPVRWLIRFNYSTEKRVKKINIPLLIGHSREDDLVPFSHGRRLFQAANEPKTFMEMQGGHNNGFLETGKRYVQTLDDFITLVMEKTYDED